MASSSTPPLSDWDGLPEILLQEIFYWLPLQSRLQASVVCRNWREILFTPDLWRNQQYYLNNDNAVKRMQLLCERGCTTYARSLNVVWPEVCFLGRNKREQLEKSIRSQLVTFFVQISEIRNLEHFVFIIEKRKPCNQCLNMTDAKQEQFQLIRESIGKMIKNSHKLTYVSFGCSPQVYVPNNVLQLLHDKAVSNIKELHVGRTDSGDISQGVMLDFLSTGTKVDALCNLQHLSIDWHTITPAFLNAFNSRNISSPGVVGKDTLKTLSIFVADHHCTLDTDNHPDSDSWRLFAGQNKGVRISLVFVHQVGGVCSEMQHIYPVYMLKFLECEMICEVAYGQLISWHKDTLQAHVMAYISNCLTELDNGHILWMYMRACSLKYITVIGYFIYDEIVKLVAAEFAPTLEVFHVPKNQILTSAEASYFMVPISGSKVTELSRGMEGLMHRPWRPLRRHPLKENYFSAGTDDQFYLNPAPQDWLF